MKQSRILLIFCLVFSHLANAIVETRHDLDNDGRTEFYRIIEDNIIIGVTINEFQIIEKIQYKASFPDKKNYIEATYKRVGEKFKLVKSYSTNRTIFYASVNDSCIKTKFEEYHPGISGISTSGFREAMKAYSEGLEARTESIIDNSCRNPENLNRDIADGLKYFLETSPSGNRFSALKQCIAQGPGGDQIISSFVDYLPFLFRPNGGTDFSIGRISCNLNEDEKLGAFTPAVSGQVPQVRINPSELNKYVTTKKAVRKSVVKSILLKEMLRASGMRDEKVSLSSIENCIEKQNQQDERLNRVLTEKEAADQKGETVSLGVLAKTPPDNRSSEFSDIGKEGIETTFVSPLVGGAKNEGASPSANPPAPAKVSAAAPSASDTYDATRPVNFPTEIQASDVPNPGSPNFGRAIVSLVKDQLIAPALASVRGGTLANNSAPASRNVVGTVSSTAKTAGRVTVITPSSGRAVSGSVSLEDGAAHVPTAEQLAAQATSKNNKKNGIASSSSAASGKVGRTGSGGRRGIASVGGGATANDPTISGAGSDPMRSAGNVAASDDVIRTLARAPYTEVADLIAEKDYATIQSILKDKRRSQQLIQILRRNSITIFDSRGNIYGAAAGRVILKDTGSQIVPANN
ncbi:MAG: hypothetical protein LW875_06870 [Proteobacteria bacterium]|nr:hypothetical protein [Pseudomonadota bacterium]